MEGTEGGGSFECLRKIDPRILPNTEADAVQWSICSRGIKLFESRDLDKTSLHSGSGHIQETDLSYMWAPIFRNGCEAETLHGRTSAHKQAVKSKIIEARSFEYDT